MYTTPIVAQDVSAFVLVGKCMPNYIREIQTYNVCDAWLTRRDLGFYYTEWLPDIIMQERWLMLHLIVQLRHVTCEKTESVDVLWLCHHIHYALVTAAQCPQGNIRSDPRTLLTTYYCGTTTHQGIFVHLMNVDCCARRCDERGRDICSSHSGEPAALFSSVLCEVHRK